MFRQEIEKFKHLKASILVYQMGKVASRAIYSRLYEDGYSVTHFHFLSGFPGFFTADSPVMRLFQKFRTVVMSALLKAYIFCKRKQYRIITLTRDPMERNVSLLFHQFHRMIQPTLSSSGLAVTEMGEKELLEHMFTTRLNQDYPLQWFDGELKRIFGIDVFAHEFDREKGYAVICKGRVSVLVLRSEDLSDNEEIIREFTGDEHFKLVENNRGSKKWYSSMYKRFIEEYLPDEALLDHLYSSKYMQHFYSPEQIEAFRKKWRKAN